MVASEKGVVVGRLQYREDGDEIDCTKMGIGGKAIPSNMTKVCACVDRLKNSEIVFSFGTKRFFTSPVYGFSWFSNRNGHAAIKHDKKNGN